MSAAAHIRRQTALSIVINVALSALFFLLIFGRNEVVSVWGLRGYAADFVPQSFMIALMSVLMPGLATEKKRRSGLLECLPRGTRLPDNLPLRALILAALSAVAGGAAAVFLLRLAGFGALDWSTAFVLKLVYGGLLGGAITPVGLRAGLSQRPFAMHEEARFGTRGEG